MAVYREAPKCHFCGKVIAKAIHRDNIPNFIGDTFSHWEYFDCNCKDAKEWRKGTKSKRSDLAEIIDGQKTANFIKDFFPEQPSNLVSKSEEMLKTSVMEEIRGLLLYNNIDYIIDSEIEERALKIIKLVQGH